MTTTDLEPIELADEHVGSALHLLGPLLPGWDTETAADVWDWKHKQGPWGPSRVAGFVVKGSVVAVGAFMPWRWRWGDQIVSGVQAGDTATHPDWGRRGLFSRLISKLAELHATDTESWAFGTPNPASLTPYLRLGWESLGPTPQRIRPVRILRLVTQLRTHHANGTPSVDHPCDIQEPDRRLCSDAPVADALIQPGLEDLLTRWHAADPAATTLRSAEYLRWRYQMNTWLPYGALFVAREGGSALVVARPVCRGALRALLVCELLATPDRVGASIARELLRGLASLAQADYVSACVKPGTLEAQILGQSGFLPAGRRGPVIIMRSLGTGLDNPPAPLRSWRLSFGDLEVL